ncbi:DUF1315 family protein [Alcanivorax quisquiliarum]|uniref:YeaC family protein n=1 Tax=Alcanivorax quisquiliarum TaxID=2933565 RepID=A0ABT0E4B1_9GAMM|nr:DUF1315 family protein [Alcanivorax quisquiliarum]MCK0536534.1 YeaC family protein [Alcanivorax quisquiliarum]
MTQDSTPRDFAALVDSMSMEVWHNMRRAVETGRWPDGRRLTAEQRQLSLQAVLAWEVRNEVPEDQRTGFVPVPECDTDDPQTEQPVDLRPAKGGSHA